MHKTPSRIHRFIALIVAIVIVIAIQPIRIMANNEAKVIVSFIYPSGEENTSTPQPSEATVITPDPVEENPSPSVSDEPPSPSVPEETPSPSVQGEPEETSAPPASDEPEETPSPSASAEAGETPSTQPENMVDTPIVTVYNTPDALPDELQARVLGDDEQEVVEAVSVRWQSADFEAGVPGEYRFDAALNGNYEYDGSMPYAIVIVNRSMMALRSMPVTAWDGTSVASFIDGRAGTESDPYVLSSAEHLAYLAQEINAGRHESVGKYYLLSADINLGNKPWTPIGYADVKLAIKHTLADSPRASTNYRPFRGTFMGNGKTIYNLNVQAPWGKITAESDYKGLFGLVEDATITGLGIETASIYGGAATGTLVGYAYGEVSISGCYVTGTDISSKESDNFGIGGLLGVYDIEEAYGVHALTIDNCEVTNMTMISTTARASSTGSETYANHTAIGGILGMGRAYLSAAANTNAAIVISNCATSGNITFSKTGGTTYSMGAGGIAGSIYLYNAHLNVINIDDANADVNVSAMGYRVGYSGVMGAVDISRGNNNRVNINRPVVNATISGESGYNKFKGGVLGVEYVGSGTGNEVYIDGGVDSDGNKLGSVSGSVSASGAHSTFTGGVVGGFETGGDYTKLTVKDIASSADVTVGGDHSSQLGGGIGGSLVSAGIGNEIEADGVVVNGIVKADNTYTHAVGGIIGEANFATDKASKGKMMLQNCYTYGDVSSTGSAGCHYVGGIIGHFNASDRAKQVRGDIINCHATGNVTAGHYYAGGVIGFSYIYSGGSVLNIDKCSATGDVSADSYYVGGFAGYLEISEWTKVEELSYTYISNSYATGDAYSAIYFVGGFVGHSHGGNNCPEDSIVFENCWASGDARSKSHDVGGFAGRPFKGNTFINCYATGDASGTGDVGGFVGGNVTSTGGAGKYINCYATGNVYGTGAAGGFGGNMNEVYVENCYSIGSVNGGTSTGAFVGTTNAKSKYTNCFASGTVTTGKGFSYDGNGTYSNCFFDKTTTTVSTSSKAGITGLSTEDMLDEDSFSSWDALNVWHVSLSNRQRGEDNPWYIDDGATYPYLYYQADGFDTDDDGLGDGYFDPQKEMPADFESTNYYVGVLMYNDGAGENVANDTPLAQNRYDFSFSSAKSLSFKAMTIGAERAYFPYIYATGTADYNKYKYWFEDGYKNSDTDGDQWVSTYREGRKKSFTAGQLISFGSLSRTNIVAFCAGPGAIKSNDSPTWQLSTSSSYTFTGHKVTYKTEFTNYSPVADWKGIGLSDPLPKGVTLVNDFVFLNRGGVSTHMKDYTSVPAGDRPKTQQQLDDEGNGETAEPYFTYEAGEGDYAGRYVLSLFNLPELEYADIRGGLAVFDSMDVEFVAQVEEDALSAKYPVASLDEAAYRDVDNIRNIGSVTGTMHFWDPAGLMLETPVKTPMMNGSNPVRVDVNLRIDDGDRDPIYNAWMVIYSSNHRAVDSALADRVIDKDYFLSDNSRAHTVIPNDDPNDPADNPHLRKDYANFDDPSDRYRFDGWFYFDSAADEAAYEARSDGLQQPQPDRITEISMEEITSGLVLDPGSDAGLRGRNVTLYARWRLRGPVFNFLKHDDQDQPLAGAMFDLYYWEGGTEPEAADNYVTDANTTSGKWVKQNDAAIESGTGGYVELTFPMTGSFQLVESAAPAGYYTPKVQWRFVADADSVPQQLTEPVTIEPATEEAPLIDFTSVEDNGETSWFLLNYLSGDELPLNLPFRKVDASDMTVPLAGVEFNLYRCAKNHTHEEIVTEAVIDGGDCWQPLMDGEAIRAFTTDTDGYVTLEGVRQWDYMLVESKTNEGFMRPVGQWLIELDMSKKGNGKYTIIGKGEMLPPAFAIDDDEDEFLLVNLRSFPMVNSGAFGTKWYTTGGAMIMAAAMGWLAFSWRRNRLGL